MAQPKNMKAFFVAEPQIELYIAIDADDLSIIPAGALQICSVDNEADLIKAIGPYFVLGRQINDK